MSLLEVGLLCVWVGGVGAGGALDGGVPMSHVEFKKCQCRMSLVFLPSLSCH